MPGVEATKFVQVAEFKTSGDLAYDPLVGFQFTRQSELWVQVQVYSYNSSSISGVTVTSEFASDVAGPEFTSALGGVDSWSGNVVELTDGAAHSFSTLYIKQPPPSFNLRFFASTIPSSDNGSYIQVRAQWH